MEKQISKIDPFCCCFRLINDFWPLNIFMYKFFRKLHGFSKNSTGCFQMNMVVLGCKETEYSFHFFLG